MAFQLFKVSSFFFGAVLLQNPKSHYSKKRWVCRHFCANTISSNFVPYLKQARVIRHEKRFQAPSSPKHKTRNAAITSMEHRVGQLPYSLTWVAASNPFSVHLPYILTSRPSAEVRKWIASACACQRLRDDTLFTRTFLVTSAVANFQHRIQQYFYKVLVHFQYTRSFVFSKLKSFRRYAIRLYQTSPKYYSPLPGFMLCIWCSERGIFEKVSLYKNKTFPNLATSDRLPLKPRHLKNLGPSASSCNYHSHLLEFFYDCTTNLVCHSSTLLRHT